MFKYGKDKLTVGKALQIARGQLKAGIDAATWRKIRASYEAVNQIAQGDAAVYGINTGFGPLCDTKISKEDTIELQRNLLLSHSVGVGDPIPKEIAKMMLILKVKALAQGYSGVSPNILDRILWHIEQDIIPVVPEQGSVGASGDLAPLAHLFLPLLGEGKVYENGKIRTTKSLFKKYNIKPAELSAKDGLALINGTQFIAAHAIYVVESLHNCLAHADLIAAMMIEGLQGSKTPFDERLHKTRPFPGNIHVAKRIDALLSGSKIMKSHENCGRVQDPYSLRCVPQVHGASRTAWLHLKEAVEVEINSVTDNPVIFSKDFTISGGNFHGQPLALPLDYACLAASELGNISDRRSYLSLDGISENVPIFLMENLGLNSGFMILQYASAALASENKGLCFPSSADSIPTSLGQEDHVSMGSIGARKALQVCNNVKKILAIEMVCAAQAVDFQRPLKSSKVLENIHEYIRTKIPHATKDEIFSKHIDAAIEVIDSKELLRISKSIDRKSKSEFHDLFEVY